MRRIKSIYKHETGRDVQETEFGVVRRRGVFVLDPQEIDDEDVFYALGRNFYVSIPDVEYIRWMEEKLDELIK